MIISPSDFCLRWQGQLVLASPALIQCLPPRARSFLSLSGLPNDAGFCISFAPIATGLVELSRLLHGSVSLRWYRHFVIACDLDIGLAVSPFYFCLENSDDEKVVAVERRGPMVRFVNSGVPELATFLLVSREILHSTPTDVPAVPLLQEQFERIDPASLDNPETWWSLILEDIATMES